MDPQRYLIVFVILITTKFVKATDSGIKCEAFSPENRTIVALKDLDLVYDLNLVLYNSSAVMRSVRIAKGCKFLACSETKMMGKCMEFDQTENLKGEMDFKSASCDCSPQPVTSGCTVLYNQWHFSGRSRTTLFPGSVEQLRQNERVKSLVLRDNCTLSFWGNKGSRILEKNLSLIDEEISGNYYCCHCDASSKDVCNSARNTSQKLPLKEEVEDGSEFVKYGKKIIGIGRNYRWKDSELTEVLKVPDEPIVFLKPSTSYIVEGQKIQLPKSLGAIFYEAELGVVIGKRGKSIAKSSALDYVAGYFIGLDMTAKEFLKKSISLGKPWEIGKGFDTASAVGHFIPKRLIPNPNDIELECKINGTVTQSENTSKMIFDVPTLISYISKFMTLEPHDVILTGTPDGFGAVTTGDIIEARLGNLTTIRFEVEVVD